MGILDWREERYEGDLKKKMQPRTTSKTAQWLAEQVKRLRSNTFPPPLERQKHEFWGSEGRKGYTPGIYNSGIPDVERAPRLRKEAPPHLYDVPGRDTEEFDATGGQDIASEFLPLKRSSPVERVDIRHITANADLQRKPDGSLLKMTKDNPTPPIMAQGQSNAYGQYLAERSSPDVVNYMQKYGDNSQKIPGGSILRNGVHQDKLMSREEFDKSQEPFSYERVTDQGLESVGADGQSTIKSGWSAAPKDRSVAYDGPVHPGAAQWGNITEGNMGEETLREKGLYERQGVTEGGLRERQGVDVEKDITLRGMTSDGLLEVAREQSRGDAAAQTIANKRPYASKADKELDTGKVTERYNKLMEGDQVNVAAEIILDLRSKGAKEKALARKLMAIGDETWQTSLWELLQRYEAK